MPNFCGLCRRTISYSTIQYPKIDFWRAEIFFQVEFMILFLRTYWSLSTYMMYGSIFTVHTRTGRDGTGRDGRQFNLLILVRNLYQIETRKGPPTHVIENTSFVKIKVDSSRVARELSSSALPLAS